MKHPSLPLFASLFAAALFAFSVHAQDSKSPATQPQSGTAPAQEAAKPAPGPGQEPDSKIYDDMFACLAEGLPENWKKTWVTIDELDRSEMGSIRNYEAKFYFATDANDAKGKPLKPCGAERVLQAVGALNDYLPESQRRWTGAIFSFTRDGKFEAKYDYTPRKPEPAKPAAKPTAKKTAPSKKQK